MGKSVLHIKPDIISTKQFSEENGGIVSLRSIKKTEENPKGIMFTEHFTNGQSEDIRGIGCVNRNGDVVMVAISRELASLNDWELSRHFPYLHVAKAHYKDKTGQKQKIYLFLKDSNDIDKYLFFNNDIDDFSFTFDKTKRNGEINHTPFYLFFDTETTGLPIDDSAPASNTKNWPRLVQLAWILTDKDGIVLSSNSRIVKPEGFTISNGAIKVHGIDTAKAMRDGKPLKSVIKEFLNAAERAKYIVGHNISFDQKVVGAELYRLGIEDTISTVRGICTMRSSVDYCEMSGGYYGYKPPKLQELYQKLFGCNFDNAHDAMADVKATMKCFFELKRREVVELMFEELGALLPNEK